MRGSGKGRDREEKKKENMALKKKNTNGLLGEEKFKNALTFSSISALVTSPNCLWLQHRTERLSSPGSEQASLASGGVPENRTSSVPQFIPFLPLL